MFQGFYRTEAHITDVLVPIPICDMHFLKWNVRAESRLSQTNSSKSKKGKITNSYPVGCFMTFISIIFVIVYSWIAGFYPDSVPFGQWIKSFLIGLANMIMLLVGAIAAMAYIVHVYSSMFGKGGFGSEDVGQDIVKSRRKAARRSGSLYISEMGQLGTEDNCITLSNVGDKFAEMALPLNQR
jgi:hypothetical protein